MRKAFSMLRMLACNIRDTSFRAWGKKRTMNIHWTYSLDGCEAVGRNVEFLWILKFSSCIHPNTVACAACLQYSILLHCDAERREWSTLWTIKTQTNVKIQIHNQSTEMWGRSYLLLEFLFERLLIVYQDQAEQLRHSLNLHPIQSLPISPQDHLQFIAFLYQVPPSVSAEFLNTCNEHPSGIQ